VEKSGREWATRYIRRQMSRLRCAPLDMTDREPFKRKTYEDRGFRQRGQEVKTRQPYHQPGVLRVLQSKEETRAFYNKIAKVYDLLAERSEQPVRRAGLAMLDARPGEKVLEIGFGTGHSLITLAQAIGPSGRVFGIDLSEKMVQAAQQLAREKGLEKRIELACGDALHLPYAAETLDGIFMSFTLELFDTPEIPLVLAECRRVLKTGGRMVVVGMSRVAPNGLVTEIFEWTHRHFPNYLDCRPILVRQALEDAGFRTRDHKITKMWVNVEIVRAQK
jgi:demethylmenaquinone methyltransferase/2-methoxy-6-polyprenyl-1,4-benzoquinol methylase